MSDNGNKDTRVNLRLHSSERQTLEDEAKEANMVLSAYLRHKLGLSNARGYEGAEASRVVFDEEPEKAREVLIEEKVPKDSVHVLPAEVQEKAEGKPPIDKARFDAKTKEIMANRGTISKKGAEEIAERILNR